MQQIVILGGGAAGLAAALAAAQSAPAGAVRVTVLDRNPRCGKKLLATGNGRCNLDNTGIAPEQYFTADPAALRPLLAAVDAAAPLEWFAALGLYTRVAGLLVAINFAVAIWMVDGKQAYPVAFPALMLVAAALCLMFTGPGRWSLDRLWRKQG